MNPLDRVMRPALDQASYGTVFGCLLVASYAYYIKDESVMEDTLFDSACKLLLKHWKEWEHPHKKLVTQADLRAGTMFAIMDSQYPTIVKVAANDLIAGA